jgi:polysaccharide export outer membrane protein
MFSLLLPVLHAEAPEYTHVAYASQSAQPNANPAQGSDKTPKQRDDKQLTEKGTKADATTQSVLTPEQRLTYIIGVEDELQISVWREPELSTSVVVRPDGMITLPLVNDVKAVGLKTEELQNLLIEKLKNFVNEPQVTVIVRSIRSRKVNLVGEVGRQGTYPINGDMTVLELLAAAGGLGPFAKADSIYILREENGKKIRIPFHYKKAVAGKSENVVLQPGDLVVVP